MEKSIFLRYIGSILKTDICLYSDKKGFYYEETLSILHENVFIKYNELCSYILEHKDFFPFVFSLNNKYIFSVVKTKNGLIIIGPVQLSPHIAVKHNINVKKIMKLNVDRYIDMSSFGKFTLMLSEFCTGEKINYEQFYLNNLLNTNGINKVLQVATSIIVENNESTDSHHTYARVSRLEECVATGNVDMVADTTLENLSGKHGVTASDELRNSKNMSIVGVALITRSAISAGIDYEVAYSLSDSFIRRIENVKTNTELNDAYIQCTYTFTKLVAEHLKISADQKNNINYYCFKTKNIIKTHMAEFISIQKIADELKVTPNYLSAIFKKNEGITISDYVQKVKISQAKRLILYSNMSLSSISFHLGYSSQSHFSKNFKLLTGITPKEYKHKFAFGINIDSLI